MLKLEFCQDHAQTWYWASMFLEAQTQAWALSRPRSDLKLNHHILGGSNPSLSLVKTTLKNTLESQNCGLSHRFMQHSSISLSLKFFSLQSDFFDNVMNFFKGVFAHLYIHMHCSWNKRLPDLQSQVATWGPHVKSSSCLHFLPF